VIGDHLLYAPPLTITEAQVDDLIAILDESLRVVRSDLARSC
jgi:adenosylmethionine-8-amino-7-oxononanoate aminotransferase